MVVIEIILLFSVLILGHELGHFTLAKINGVKVEEFSLGMGKRLFVIKGKETEYSLRLFPIGGYVKMLGEEGEADDPRSFSRKSPAQRLSIIAAGPLMNLVIAVVLFTIFSTQAFPIPTIKTIKAGSPSEIAGLKSGDELKTINNKAINNWQDLGTEINNGKGSIINISYMREGLLNKITITPTLDKALGYYIIGISPVLKSPTFFQSVKSGFTQTGSVISQTLGFFKTALMGKASINDVGGPVTIFKMSNQYAKQGILTFIGFGAILSISLAIFNIIPFPALDGGWIFILLFEMITRKKPDPNKVGFVNYIGFMILIIFMILVTIKDVIYPVTFK
ncbi:MAG TPA: M50 family metallopeptidase [Clostridiaceae bacterium]